MNAITVLIVFPLLAALLIFLTKNNTVRDMLVRIGAVITAVLTLAVVVLYFNDGISFNYPHEEIMDYIMVFVEIAVAIFVITIGFKNKKYLVSVFSLTQTSMILWFEFTQKNGIEVEHAFILDKLSAIMILIIGIVGSMIALYAVGYMKAYHEHHTDIPVRKNFFLSILFLFLSAMFGLVLSNNLTYLYFCWEVTTLCSFLLIGYTKTPEAKNNAFRALVYNLGGGLAFALAIVYIGMKFSVLELSTLVAMKPEVAVLIPVFLLSIAALTKSAQLPFSSWLLGAMVAPTPSSALLHSATMVKAGVYLVIRLAPLLGDSAVGRVVTLVGGVTFLACSLMAITQSDAKKILAYSTIANLGLIVICASIGTQESLWAAILLIIFHAVSKSLLFITVGSVEHQIGSRNVEDMGLLFRVSDKLAVYMIIGIAGMFLAPFGMLISKWVAMKAFMDSNNIVIVIMLAYGSAATLFYWTKWMGKLVTRARVKKHHEKHEFSLDEHIPIFIQAALVVISCFTFPLISKYALVPYLTQLFHKEALIPIGTSDVKIMLFMLSMLIILPIGFIPIYRGTKRRKVLVYMAGANTGDNESFRDSLGNTTKVDLRNWYMEGIFGVKRLTLWGNLISIGLLCAGVILLIGGLAA
ncbi:NADH-quinone oxidoreductase subunit 5 family protein [Lachnoclostridium phytofermentans]|uniref:NADH dehydrogenase (Quinone) n=1 Tax=Lachnoclostridium phytofermentans (strain ATCC 700394 / DSM 18823 / ISDg) TaxID=357809 RepID=A9KS70_LACP7|nr:proton-conducting transporter membrane subunit [Lachnoclostridium phytofermentans]ABX42102.1 NADH dehydrogenase (quinone) [Lachnoclostridium phytofermentans ISDg]